MSAIIILYHYCFLEGKAAFAIDQNFLFSEYRFFSFLPTLSTALQHTTSKLSVLKQQHLSCLQICNLGRACQGQFISVPCGISWHTSMARYENHLKSHSLKYLAVDANCCLGPYLGLIALTLIHNLSMQLGLPDNMVAGFYEQAF